MSSTSPEIDERKAAEKAKKAAEKEAKDLKKAQEALEAATKIYKYFPEFKTLTENDILLSNYDNGRQTLTIMYPTFDLTKKDERTKFIDNFSKFCAIIITKENETTHTDKETESLISGICIQFYEYDPKVTEKPLIDNDSLIADNTNPKVRSYRRVTRAKNLTSSAVAQISESIYDECLQDSPNFKDVEDDVNSPKRAERLKISMDGAYLQFFLNPKGLQPKRSFAPTGHGGRNAFLQLKNDTEEFLCGGLMCRSRIANKGDGVFNCFGGSPDYDENIQITIIREMLEEMFETLFRDPRVIKPEAEQTEDYKNAIKLLNEILGQEQTIDPLDQFVSNLHTNCDLQLNERFKQVVLTERFNKINWNGLGYPDHPLSTGERVLSLTTYYLPNQKIETQFSAEEVAKIVMTNYAKNELNGVFVLKITPNYKTFFTNFDGALLQREKTQTQDEFLKIIQDILDTTPIDFLWISYYNTLYSNDLKFISTIENDEKKKKLTLIITIKHISVSTLRIIFLKIALNETFNPNITSILKDGSAPFFMNDGGSETYFMLKYINDLENNTASPDPLVSDLLVSDPLSAGGRKKFKTTKKNKPNKPNKPNKTYKKKTK